MPAFPPKVGQIVKSVRDIHLANNIHVSVMSDATPIILPKGTLAEITSVQQMHIEVNCKDGQPHLGIAAWGLKLRIAKVVWGISFE